MIAALYVDPRGCYAGLAAVDLWDEARDARNYAGPWPVVAHPPKRSQRNAARVPRRADCDGEECDEHPTCADCGATLPTDTGVDADELDVECTECGAPHAIHRTVLVTWYAERTNRPARQHASGRPGAGNGGDDE